MYLISYLITVRTFSRLSPSKYPVAYKLGFLWQGRSANYIITILQTVSYIAAFRKPREIVQYLIAYTLFLIVFHCLCLSFSMDADSYD